MQQSLQIRKHLGPHGVEGYARREQRQNFRQVLRIYASPATIRQVLGKYVEGPLGAAVRRGRLQRRKRR